MSETISFTPVPNSGEDLGKLVPDKFSNVLWIEDQEPNAKRLEIGGQLCEIFSTGLQLIGEEGFVAPHREAEDVDEWVVPLTTIGKSNTGGRYKIENDPDRLELIKNLHINELVGATFELRFKKEGVKLLVNTPGKTKCITARAMPAGKTHEARAEANCLYFVFKTKPISTDYSAEPSIISTL